MTNSESSRQPGSTDLEAEFDVRKSTRVRKGTTRSGLIVRVQLRELSGTYEGQDDIAWWLSHILEVQIGAT